MNPLSSMTASARDGQHQPTASRIDLNCLSEEENGPARILRRRSMASHH
jgi:hypothetical protein